MLSNPLREARRGSGACAPDKRRSRSLSMSGAWLAVLLATQLGLSGLAAADETPPSPGPVDSDAPPVPPPPGATPASVPPPPSAPVVTMTPVETPPAGAPEGEMLRWAGARFDWYHGATLATLGIREETVFKGFKGSGEDELYGQSFAFSGGVFIVKQAPHQLRASTAISVQTELTNSEATTRNREPQINDIPLRLTYTPVLFSTGSGGPIKGAAALYDPTLLGRGDHRTWGILFGSVAFPTSSRSQGIGRLLTTSLSAGARQQIKLLGSDAPGLTHAIVGISGGWTHHFDKASTPVSSNVQVPRQSGSFTRVISDQLSGDPLVENTVGGTISLVLSLYAGLQLESSFGFGHQIPYSFKGNSCEVQLTLGCLDLPESEATTRDYTSFSLGLSYLILPEAAVALGYENTAYTMKLNGQSRDPFFSPSSQFYAGLSLSFDRLYQRFAEPENLATLLGEKPEPGATE